MDQLALGEPFRLRGYELPEDHPAWADYGPSANLVLTADDVSMPHDEWSGMA